MEGTEEIVKTKTIIPDKMVYDPNTYNYYDKNKNKQVSDKINNKHNEEINFIINSEFNNNVDIDTEYITNEQFSKLNKYQTIYNKTTYTINKYDISEIPQYDSVEQYLRERERQLLIPLEKQEPQLILKYVYDSSDCVTFNKQQKVSQNKQLIINNKKSKELLSKFFSISFNWKKYFALPEC